MDEEYSNMTQYNGTERRKGVEISRDAYIDYHMTGDPKKVAGADYDMLENIKYCLSKKIDELCKKCSERPTKCDKIYIRRIHEKVALSWFGFLGIIFLLLVLVDAGFLDGKIILQKLAEIL